MEVYVNDWTYESIKEITKIKSLYGQKVSFQDTMRLLLLMGIKQYKNNPKYIKYKYYVEEKEKLNKQGEEWSMSNLISKIGTVNPEDEL